MPTLASENYRYYFHDGAEVDDIDLFIARREKNVDNIKAFMGLASLQREIDYHLYPSFESKGLAIRNTTLSHFDAGNNAVISVVNDYIRGDTGQQDASLLLRKYWGIPKHHMLEQGLSVYLGESWRGADYEDWAIRYFTSGNILSLTELLDNSLIQRESYLLCEPLSASFVAFALEKFGPDVFRAQYLEWIADPNEISTLESGWLRYLQRRAAEKGLVVKLTDRRMSENDRSFQKGFCHAHEGYRIHNGYLSQKSDDALSKLAEMDVNAVSITPFTYMRNPNRPTTLPFVSRAGSENDESVIHSAQTAKSLGMRTMLKPHIWLGRSWPGAIEMTTAEDWATFYDNYYRWIRHYAILAEMYEMDILCIGVELSKATVGHESEWVEIISRIRKLFSGQLTYAANWGPEFEQVNFWKELDFIGINCYYPLAESDSTDKKAIQSGMDDIVEKIEAVHEQYERPVLFTEIGFTSTPAPWTQPHLVAGRKPVDLEAQELCYETVLGRIYEKDWIRGIYWWKWPSYLSYGGKNDNDFTPNNKPAEQVVRKWYAKDWD